MDPKLQRNSGDTLDAGDFETRGWCSPAQTQAAILSTVIADGLGRIGDEYSSQGSVICRNHWCSMGQPIFDIDNNPVMFNGTREETCQVTCNVQGPGVSQIPDGDGPNQQMLYSFPQPANYATEWTEVSLKIKRYGYGWGFNSKIVKAAAAILSIHAIIILAHCCYMLFTGRYYTYADTIGDLVALALKSRPPSQDWNLDTHESRKKSDARTTAVRRVQGSRPYEQQLEIVIDPKTNGGGELVLDHDIRLYEGA